MGTQSNFGRERKNPWETLTEEEKLRGQMMTFDCGYLRPG